MAGNGSTTTFPWNAYFKWIIGRRLLTYAHVSSGVTPVHPLTPILDISSCFQMKIRGVLQYKNPEDPCVNADLSCKGPDSECLRLCVLYNHCHGYIAFVAQM